MRRRVSLLAVLALLLGGCGGGSGLPATTRATKGLSGIEVCTAVLQDLAPVKAVLPPNAKAMIEDGHGKLAPLTGAYEETATAQEALRRLTYAGSGTAEAAHSVERALAELRGSLHELIGATAQPPLLIRASALYLTAVSELGRATKRLEEACKTEEGGA